MYILYLDESGTQGNEASYFVLAGLAVYEREIHWYVQDLNNVQAQRLPASNTQVHFHATRLRAREGAVSEAPWSTLGREERYAIKDAIYDISASRQGVLFACAIEKTYAAQLREDPYERAFEEIIGRFDLFLGRLNQTARATGKEEQRGLIVLAESKYQRTIGDLAGHFQEAGTRWRQLHNVTDIPYFAPARATRLLQCADFVSNAVYGRYHGGLAGDFDKIAHKFDREGSQVHGLVHLTHNSQCMCPGCLGRRPIAS